jgi:WD40 repeat protein/uncharacterized caspase-like protein
MAATDMKVSFAAEESVTWHTNVMVKDGRIATDGLHAYSHDGFTLQIWDIASGRILRSIELTSLFDIKWPMIGAAAASPSLDSVMVASEGRLDLFDLQSSKRRWSVSTEFDVKKLSWSDDGSRIIAAADFSSKALIFDATNGTMMSNIDFSAVPLDEKVSTSSNTIESIALSPNGETVFLGGWNEAGLYAALTGRPLQRLHHDGIFFGGAFSPDSKLAATAMSDNGVCLWDATSGELLKQLKGHQKLVTTVTFSPNGSVLASSGNEAGIRLWSTANGEPTTTLKGHRGGVNGLSFSPDGRSLLSVGNDSASRLWPLDQVVTLDKADTAPSPHLVVQLGHAGGVTAAAISVDNKLIATGGADGAINIIEAQSGRVIRRISAHPGALGKINSIFLAFNESSLVTASDDRTVGVWDLATGTRQLQINFDLQVDALALLDDGKRLITASEDGGVITVWDGKTGEQLQEIGEYYDRTHGVTAIAPFPDGHRIATSRRDGTVRIFDIATGVEQQSIKVDAADIVYDISISPDGNRLVSVNLNGVVAVWDMTHFEQLHRWDLGKVQIFSMDIAADGSEVVLGTNTGEAYIYDLNNGKHLRTLPKIEKSKGWGVAINAVAFSPDGSRFVIGAGSFDEEQGITQLWQKGGAALLHEYSGQATAVLVAAFSPDGNFVAVDGLDETVLWDLSTGGIAARLDHELRKKAIFVSDGNSVVVPQSDNVMVRTLRNGQQNALIPKDDTRIFSLISHVAVSPDGKRVLTDEFEGLFLRELNDGRVLQQYDGIGMGGVTPVFTPQGDGFLTVSHDAAVLWDINSSSALLRIEQPGAFIGFDTAEFTPDGRYVVILENGGKNVILLDMQQKKIARRFPAGSENPLTLSDSDSYWLLPSENGDLTLLNANYNGSYQLFDPVSGEEKLRLSSEAGYISAAALSPAGDKLATAGGDRTVSVWQRETGALSARLTHHSDRVNSINFSADGKQLLTASSDGSVGLWDIDSGNLMASLLGFSNGDWAVVAPDGRYDSNSPGDLPELSWVISDEPLKPLAVEIFIREYFEPRLLVRLLGGELMPPVKLLTEVNRLQPISEIVSLVPSAKDPASVDVTIAVTDVQDSKGQHSGARNLRLFRDGQLVAYGLESDSVDTDNNGTALMHFPGIRLPTNRLAEKLQFEAYAFNNDGVKGTSTHRDYLLPEGLNVRQPRAYVISVGVNSHENPAWDLRYSAADAWAVQSVLVNRLQTLGRYEEVVEVPLVSDAEHGEFAARKEVVAAALGALAGAELSSELQSKYPQLVRLRRANPEDTVILTFSGHGYADEKGLFYLFPENIGTGSSRSVDAATLSRAISGNELNQWLRDVDAGEMLMIIDACNASASVEGGGFKPGPMGSKGFGQLAFDKGMRILTATQAENVALESDLIGHGIMTYALIREGIEQSRADRQPENGEIMVSELLSYGVERVPQLYDEVKRGKVTGARGLVRVHKPNNAEQTNSEIKVQHPGLFDFVKSRRDLVIERHSLN